MTKEAFEEALASLKDAELIIEESEYNRQAFGSWYITVLAKPDCRIVWDGKEENLRVERKTDKFFNGLPLWDELWLSINPNRNDFLNGIQELINECRK
jgi:hypothetical protein